MVGSGRGFDLEGLIADRKVSAVDLPAMLPQRHLVSVRPTEVRSGPGRIEWRWGHPRGLPGSPASDCLFAFLRLADANDPEAFAHFGAVHGVLALKEDGLPVTFEGGSPPEVPDSPPWHYEPIEWWQHYALNAKMILILAMALRGHAAIDVWQVLKDSGIPAERLSSRRAFGNRWYRLEEEDWDRALGQVYEEESPPYGLLPGLLNPSLVASAPDVESQRRSLVAWFQSHWLDLANIVPAVEWSHVPAKLVLRLSEPTGPGGGPDVAWWPRNMLFSVLAAELTGIVCSDRNVAQCARCGQLHPSKIKVRTDQPNYCDMCRLAVRRATNRDAARRRYQRMKMERVSARPDY